MKTFLSTIANGAERAALSPSVAFALDHDEFGLNQSKLINVIDSKSSERDADGKVASGLSAAIFRPNGNTRKMEAKARLPLFLIPL
jgi:hypothetical protein